MCSEHVKMKKVRLDVFPGFQPCQSPHVLAGFTAPASLVLAPAPPDLVGQCTSITSPARHNTMPAEDTSPYCAAGAMLRYHGGPTLTQ